MVAPKFNRRDEVVITGDKLHIGLPIFSNGIVTDIQWESSATGYEYVVKIGGVKYIACENDIELYEDNLSTHAEQLLRESLVDMALDRGDREMFNQVIQGKVVKRTINRKRKEDAP